MEPWKDYTCTKMTSPVTFTIWSQTQQKQNTPCIAVLVVQKLQPTDFLFKCPVTNEGRHLRLVYATSSCETFADVYCAVTGVHVAQAVLV